MPLISTKVSSRRSAASGCLRQLWLVVTLTTALLLLASTASALTASQLNSRLAKQLRLAGGSSGAIVIDTSSGRTLFSSSANRRRIPASVQKLYTTATAIRRYGESTTFDTKLMSKGQLTASGIFRGSIYLVGDGDPTFGSLGFNRSYYGSQLSSTSKLVAAVKQLGIKRIEGRIYGDESLFDSTRGVADSKGKTSPYIGPLTSLPYNRGYSGRGFQGRPALESAKAVTKELKRQGIKVTKGAKEGTAPKSSSELAAVSSPTLDWLIRKTNHPSDNFFAETLLKHLGATFKGKGSTKAGTQIVKQELRGFGIKPVIVDGSGLSRGNRTSPREVAKLLTAMKAEDSFDAFYSSLPLAGKQGTLKKRMRGTRADGHCRAKTGTLSNVSALAGYCKVAGGRHIAFAFLMNQVVPFSARSAQDKMTAAVASYRP